MKVTVMVTCKKIILFLFILFFALVVFFPFYWMAVSSLRSNPEIFSTKINLFPRLISLSNYHDLFNMTGFLIWMANSVIVAVSTTILGIFFSTLAGFSFAKYRFVGRNVLFLIVFIMISIPRFITIIPIFRSMSSFGLINNYLALILPFAVNPFAVFLMCQYIKSIPNDLLDSARIDGLNEFQIVIRIIIPVIKPAIGAAGIFILMMSWNDYLFPLIMMSEEKKILFTVGLASLKTLYVVEYGMVMAGSFLSTLPLIAGFLLLQKQFVAGLTQGAVKQ